MKHRELSREIEIAGGNVRQAHLDRIRALGVLSTPIARLGAVQVPFGVLDCENIGGGIFQPGGDIPHMVQPVYDSGVIIDIVAWRTAEPQSWLWRTGAAWALNTDAIAADSWQDEPLAIDATPLDWLRNGATGLCILNWHAPELRQLLRIKSINADPHIARQLRGALMKPAYFPDIQIAEGLRHAA